ncbi:MAG TPA: PQQ-dependent sugar dehydrogenase [Verrucomicrobiota bacterium]|nr:hypothetical protein [Verrucomicrobiales bacterium]HRI11782.1 PQQ-dependent sugar dehydrogenase [Verrucomicrobiota bacterium]
MRGVGLLLIAAWMAGGFVWAAPVREPNTTLRLPQTPGSFGYEFADALGLQFEAPVVITAPPGETNRLFIVEQRGRIIVITNLAQPTRTVFLDLVSQTIYGGEQGLLGLAFHPDYARNGRFFVFRTCNARTGGQTSDSRHDRLSEFAVSSTNANRAAATERILLQQSDDASNHNGGDLHFGLDGYLYVSLGDEGDANDSRNNSQTITKDFFAGVLRLDVDQRPDSLAPNSHPAVVAGSYRVPADNPFVGATSFLGRPVNPAQVRTEFWAVGLRNPWRMSFDRATGELWIGDVGQGAWESVVISRSGANHGWAYREGNVAGPKTGVPTGFLTNPSFNYVRPFFVYAHGSGTTRGNSITGGLVYRGARLAQLHGQYIFADYSIGNVWALRRREGSTPPLVTRLTGLVGISAFGTDPRNGDVLVCDYQGRRILRLDYNAEFTGAPLPATLADTGAFDDLVNLTPNPGIVPYSVNLSFWSDDARKRRWFCVPDTNEFLTFSSSNSFASPAGTVWVKHFDLELTNGIPESTRRLETRFLVRNPDGVYGVTYRWDSATNATLVPEEGADETFARVVDGVPVAQTWHYPSRAECLACHTAPAGLSLSFNAAQLNGASAGNETSTHDLASLAAAGYFNNPPASLRPLSTVTTPTNEAASLEWRARSWLAVNCSPCHRTGGTGGGFFDVRLTTPTELTGLINGPLSDNRGDPANRVIVPGDLAHSQMWQRLSTRGPAQMPPLASSIVDSDGVILVRRWIEELGSPPPPDQPVLVGNERPFGLHLQVTQPANRRVILEAALTLDTGSWQALDLPGTEPVYFAEPRALDFELAPDDSIYTRVRTVGP